MANGNGSANATSSMNNALGPASIQAAPGLMGARPGLGGPTPQGRVPGIPGTRERGPGPVSRAMGIGGPKLGPFAQAHQDANQAEEQYKMNMKAHGVMDSLREELDELMGKGDMVRPEDVIQAAGRMMGHESGAFGAEDMARLLSDMPTIGGQGLATWIRMHDIGIRQVEAKLAQDTAFKQHRMGVTAIKSLAASTLQQEAEKRRQAGLPGIPSPPQMPGMVGPVGAPGPMGGNGLTGAPGGAMDSAGGNGGGEANAT